MTHTWERLEGLSLSGPYALEAWLGGDESSAFFRTSYGPDRAPALLKLIPQDDESDAQLERWRRTAELSHPNLLALLDSGEIAIDRDPYIYAVFEYPEDRLSSALANGPLSSDEVRETREPILDALRYLHAHGFVHGEVDGEHIVAVGDTVKLSTDALREIEGSGVSPVHDIRALDTVLGYEEEKAPEVRPPSPSIERAAESPALPAPPPAESGFQFKGLPFWAYALGTVLLALIVFTVTRHSDVPAEPVAAAPVSTAPARVVEPVPVPAPVVTRPSANAPRETWRVVAYTFSRYQAAAKKVEQINQKWPGAQATVFAPLGQDHPPFLVALGGKMSRSQALAMQRTARSKGMPRDTFVRNYSE